MPLSEEQIVRYSRQILLTAVGGKGQARLLEQGAKLTGEGSAQAVCAAYLAAGGTATQGRDRPVSAGEVGFLICADDAGRPYPAMLRAALLDANPDALAAAPSWGIVGELPAAFSGPAPWVALGWNGRRGAVLYRGPRGCPGCFEASAAALSNGPAGAPSVLLGALGALVFQRLTLGLSQELGGIWVGEAGELSVMELLSCPAHSSLPFPEDLSAVVAHLEAAYPEEGCGLIWRSPAGFRVQPIENAYDRLRALDPEGRPRSARDAYEFDPGEWLAACLEAERRGEALACVFHSHCEAGARFSAADRDQAAPGGSPLLPGTAYLVVSIEGGRASGARAYRWGAGDFWEIKFPFRLNAT